MWPLSRSGTRGREAGAPLSLLGKQPLTSACAVLPVVPQDVVPVSLAGALALCLENSEVRN